MIALSYFSASFILASAAAVRIAAEPITEADVKLSSSASEAKSV